MTVVALNLDLIVDIEAGVFPGEKLFDQFPADLLFPEQHLKDLVAEEILNLTVWPCASAGSVARTLYRVPDVIGGIAGVDHVEFAAV